MSGVGNTAFGSQKREGLGRPRAFQEDLREDRALHLDLVR